MSKDKQRVLDILNSMDIIESNGGEEPYALVEVNEENKELLKEAGIPLETALKYGDEEYFCIVALAFSERYANWWTGGSQTLMYFENVGAFTGDEEV